MKAKKFLSVMGILLFFLGFPAFGLMYFWNDMHSKIRNNADGPVRVLASTAMSKWDYEFIGRNLGPEADIDKVDVNITDWKKKYGALKVLHPGTSPKTWAHEYKDQVWQFARYDYPAEFEKGEATVRFTGTRLYLSEQWKIADIEVLP